MQSAERNKASAQLSVTEKRRDGPKQEKKEKEAMAQKIAELERTIAEMGKTIAARDARIEREDSYWKHLDGKEREEIPDPARAVNEEQAERIIHDEKMLKHHTGCGIAEFKLMLFLVTGLIAAAYDTTPLFRIKGGPRERAQGNRCKLTVRHALLMSLIHQRHNPRQETMAEMFGIDQTSVSRYLSFFREILQKVLPVADRMTRMIAALRDPGKLKVMIPGPGSGRVNLDGTEMPVQRPQDDGARAKTRSGKKKTDTVKLNVVTNLEKLIIFISKAVGGSMHDFGLLKEDLPDFGAWSRKAADPRTPEGDRPEFCVDLGYQGMSNLLPGANIRIPIKKHPKQGLSREAKRHNRQVSLDRISIEHAFAKIKTNRLFADRYNGTPEQLREEFNVATGIYNLKILLRMGKKGQMILDLLEEHRKREKRKRHGT